MRIFVTGGTGYIGRELVRALLARGDDVTLLARSEKSAQAVRILGATPALGSLTDTAVLNEAASVADAAIHLGSTRGPDAAAVDLAAATAMQDFLGTRPYIHTGGVWVYGNTDGIVDEDAVKNPPPIVTWRLRNEKRILDRAANGEHPVLVMPGLVYGRSGGIPQMLAMSGAKTGAVRYIGDGSNHLALVHVDDIADLYVRAVTRAEPGSVYTGVSECLPAKDVAAAVSRGAGLDGAVVAQSLDEARTTLGPLADALLLDQRISSTRAREQLGWDPAHTDTLAELARL